MLCDRRHDVQRQTRQPRLSQLCVSSTECWSLGAFADDDGHTARQILTSCVHNTPFSSILLTNGEIMHIYSCSQ